jgi:hypothetical protein
MIAEQPMHPEPAQWQAFDRGLLDPAAWERVRQPVVACDTCAGFGLDYAKLLLDGEALILTVREGDLKGEYRISGGRRKKGIYSCGITRACCWAL